MPSSKTRLPAVDGWFTLDETAPALLGSKCTSCGTFAFPKETFFCRNPECQSTEFAETELSRTGTVWSYTDACYQPPKPYVAAEPYLPFSIAAVELAAEQMVVMGQVVAGVTVDDLAVGTEVEIVLDTLYEDDENEYLVWKWRPTSPATSAAGETGAEEVSDA
ncbi:MAG TPA: OB-fold domain-containing protein [Acidimicrobiales bacterium]|jgi:uncharacterized OB-fold protein|nr:OB-fold domain-containing protein [Acidimicrobiales bacterium]